MNLPNKGRKIGSHPLLLLLVSVLLCSCAPTFPFGAFSSPPPPKPRKDPIGALIAATPPDTHPALPLTSMGYTIQVGAFANLDHAVRLERRLEARGIDAYYFRHSSGLYKVRFGNHVTYAGARAEAERLHAEGLIGRFFIVFPQSYPAARIRRTGKGDLRADLVRTARSFLGVPYRWGGTDRKDGFDCSGLTMVCYRLNGLNLPRVSRNQYRYGHPVPKADLRRGDLVFFATEGGRRVSHVGMYIGHGRFIHAPRTGETVRIARLSNPYFERTFVGARSYF